MKDKLLWPDLLLRLVMIQVGALVVSIGLEEFLLPNQLLDGGVVGISIIVSHLSQWPLGVILALANLPFIVLSARTLGLRFVGLTVYAVLSMSVWVTIFHPIPQVTQDLFLSTIFGGFLLGLGVGTVLRFGGCLDGTEILSILVAKRLPFSVGEVVMFFNVFIFGAAAFVFGVDRALYSVVAYLVAYQLIDLVLTGLNQSHSFFIVTRKPEEVSQALMADLKTSVTILKGMGGYSRVETDVLYLIIGRLDIQRAKDLILRVDQDAFITIQHVQEQIAKGKARLHG